MLRGPEYGGTGSGDRFFPLLCQSAQSGLLWGGVPREHSTGTHQRLGSITKVGSSRIRTLIIEMVWRVVLFQPNYPPVVQWREVLSGSNKVLKKKAAGAVARRPLIDIWEKRTRPTTGPRTGTIP